MKRVRESAPAKLKRRNCTFYLFRNKQRPDLLCAVPEDYPVPPFVGPEQWEFERPLRPWHDQPGFRDKAAWDGVQLNGFYLFQVTAVHARPGEGGTGESPSVREDVREVLGYLREHQSIVRRASTAGASQGPTPPERSIASLKWVEGRYVDILDALPFAVYATDAAGRITYYNEAAVTLWGRRPALGQDRWCGSWRIYLPDGTLLPHDNCPMALAIGENREVRGLEAVAERPDGTRVRFMPYPTPLQDANDNLIGAVNVLIDLGAA